MRIWDFALHWVIAERYLTVQRWKPNSDPYDEEFRRITVWVKIPGLPIEYYNKLSLTYRKHVGKKP